jgi:uncharacterized protein YbjQ (UPF0145 family)
MAIDYNGGHIQPAAVTTAFELPGFRIVRNIGLVRGIVVRSRSIVGSLGAALQTIVGGNITIYAEMCERAREDAYEIMVRSASCLRGRFRIRKKALHRAP